LAFIHQMEPWIGEEEKTAIAAYLDSGGWLTEFRKTREFERAIADFTGARHVSAVCNGTVSLYAALWSLEIGAGDEVIVPDYTMIATANAVVLAGARPVLVDVDSRDLCLDLELAEAALTERTKAILFVSVNGRAPDMDRLVTFARRHGLYLVEDAAQSLGSCWRGRHLGTFGDIGSFSFSAPKIITTGQGGALVTNNRTWIERIRRFRDFGRERSGEDEHISLGFNFKFTDLQAVIGLAQMDKLGWRVQRKKSMFQLYRSELADLPQVEFLPTDLADCAPWFVDILVSDPVGLQQHLLERQIGSRRFYPAVHTQAPYREQLSRPIAESAAARGLWLPSSSFLQDETIRAICAEIRRFYAGGGSRRQDQQTHSASCSGNQRR
jgi:perosamine synthetase